jgi:phage terminase large subunit-like protein
MKSGESMDVIKTVRYESGLWEITHNRWERKWHVAVKNENQKDFSHSMYIDEAEMEGLYELLTAVKEEV